MTKQTAAALAFFAACLVLMGLAGWMALQSVAPAIVNLGQVLESIPHLANMLLVSVAVAFIYKQIFGEGS